MARRISRRSPAQRVRLEDEEQGSGRSFRRKAETEQSGLCDEEGGAASHDIQDGILDPADPNFEQEYWLKRRTRQFFRVKGVSWWPEELPSEVEYAEALRSLENAGWCVDCILTHCLPTKIQKKLGPHYEADKLTDFLQTVLERCQFSKWFAGHYHCNEVVDGQFIVQWEQIVQIQ